MAEISIAHVWPEWHLEEKPLGKGSYGTVYKAVRKDSNLTSYSAIKIISIPQDPSEIDTLRSEGLDMNESKTYLQGIVDNFVNEIQLMQSFKGTQNIVSIEDYKVMKKVNDIGWKIYIRMELLTSLPKYTCDRKMTEADVIKLGCDICSALEMCAQRNIIHRDIKPDNIFINDFGSFKLGDFGIARTLSGMTSGMSQKGTPFYMAPEVFTTNKYDARVDICSLGLVMYKMLNNDLLPFITEKRQLLNPNERDMALERRSSGEPLPKPCEASPAMAHLILKACAHNPEDRFANASELKAALMSVSNGTYKISNPGRTSSVRAITTDPNATSGVRPAVQNVPYQSSYGNTFTPEKPKSKTPKIIAACLITALLAGGGFFAYPHVKDMVTGDTESGITEQVEGNQDTAEYSAFDEQITSIIAETDALAEAEDIEGENTETQTGLVTSPEPAELQEGTDRSSENSADQIKQQTLENAEKFAEASDYAAAMEIIEKKYKDFRNDNELNSAYNSYAEAHKKVLADEAIQSADQLSASGNHLGAYKKINQMAESIGKNAGMAEAVARYEKAYVEDISKQVDSCLTQKNKEEATRIVEEAAAEFPDNIIIQQLQIKVDNYAVQYTEKLITINDKWHWISFECPYIDPYGRINGMASGGTYDPLYDKMAAFLIQNPRWYTDTELMETWNEEYAPFGDRINPENKSTPFVNDLYHVNGLMVYKTFIINDLSEDVEYDMYCFYDNTVYIYVNGQLFYIHDGKLKDDDWTEDYQLIQANQSSRSLKDYLVEGENYIAVSIKNAWGGREFDLYIEKSSEYISLGSEWNYKVFCCPYIDGTGRMDGSAPGGYYDARFDEMRKFIEETPDFAVDYASMVKWNTAKAPMGKIAEQIGWAGSMHGLILYQSFTVNDLDLLSKWDEFIWYGTYDNTIHVYLNGKEIYADDGKCIEQDWQTDGSWELNKERILNAVTEGKNHIVVTIKDAWGARDFNCGFRAHKK